MSKLEHPYEDLTGGHWLRGNLHAHTTRSDGARGVQEVINDYAARGYDFLAITDHDIFTSETDHAQWDNRGMVLLPGNEITRNGPHLLHIGATRFVAPQADRQAILDEITARKRGDFVIVNHPDWQEGFNHCSIEKLRLWKGYAGLEIYNGVIGDLTGSPYALNKWDTLLSEGRKVWGFASDDSHRVSHVALGWNVVYAKERTPHAIVDALRTGRFYASTGVEITKIEVDENRVHLETANAERIVAHTAWGRRVAVADGNAITLDVPDNAPYVRFACWGCGEKFAWTQPFFRTA